MPICGNCKERHDSVQEVKDCYKLDPDLEPEATFKQLDFLNQLLQERNLPIVSDGDLTRREASDRITELVKSGQRHDPLGIPAGYYATPSLTGNNDLDFWKVERPTEGRWAGRVFVKRIIGGHDPERVTRTTEFAAKEAIRETGFDTAAKLYGQHLGQCYRCNRTLTDELSRQLGIGPECRRKQSAA